MLGVGFILLLVSTKVLVDLAEKMSASFRISPLIIGMTIVAIGTSFPELSVSTIASIKQDGGLAMGNIVGSNIVNVFMVFSVGILIGKLRIGTTKTQRSSLILLTVTALFIFLHFMPLGKFPQGLFLITLAVLVTIIEYKWAVFGRRHEDSKKLNSMKKEKFSLLEVIKLAVSIGAIVVGGFMVVVATQNISILTGYSTAVLGLSLTAVATSLPELLTTVFSQEENEEKITIGNIIGSNIYNLLLIGGIILYFSPNGSVPTIDWVILSFSTILFVFIIKHYSGQKVPKWIGVLLLTFLFAYIYLQTIPKS